MGASPLFRFKGTDPEYKYYTQFMDRFNIVESEKQMNASDSKMDTICSIYPKIIDIRKNHERMNSAVTFTYRGCLENAWNVAYICFMAAFETILFNKMKSNMQGRLSMACGLILGDTLEEYHKYRKQFVKLYDIRSDILHGKAYTLVDSENNLDNLGNLSKLLRHTWIKILISDDLFNVTKSDDDTRTIWLQNRQESLKTKFFEKQRST